MVSLVPPSAGEETGRTSAQGERGFDNLEVDMAEQLSGKRNTLNAAGKTGTVPALDLVDAEMQALVRDLDVGGVMVPSDHVGAAIERLLALAHSTIRHDTSWRSRRLWALRKPSRHDATGERGLAIRLCHSRPDLFYEVPAASGVFDQDGRANKKANVDLAVEVAPGSHYVLVELKDEANDPEFAAAEILRNFILWLSAKRYAPPALIVERPILQARKIDLHVWATEELSMGRGYSVVVDGHFSLPKRPGLGITLKVEFVAAHPRERFHFDLFSEDWHEMQAKG